MIIDSSRDFPYGRGASRMVAQGKAVTNFRLAHILASVYTERYFPMHRMPKDLSIKELRAHLSDVADRAERGESFRIIRRSKPSFIIMSIDAEIPEEGWETVVDFTDGGRTKGVPIKEVLEEMKKEQH